MRERPIIFNADMVRAVLDGRKTQTRRIMKVQPSADFHPMNMALETDFTARWYTPGVVDKDGYLQPAKNQVFGVAGEDEGYICPFGAVGDHLWVKETWSVVSHAFDDDGLMIDYVPDRPAIAVHEKPFGNGYYSGHAIYAADGGFTWGDDDGCVDGRSCWKPSIHMPRWASRIGLEITGVRVERLNSINEHDAAAEGVPPAGDLLPDYPGTYLTPKGDFATAEVAFQRLWQSIYGEDSWQANPWVWVIEFKRVEVE